MDLKKSFDYTNMFYFIQASYFSAKRHEVHGVVIDDNEGKVVRKLFGKWNEALYCGVAPSAKCIWRPGIYTIRIMK